MRIFISYASEQRPIADRLCHALRNDGHTVFYDGDRLERGEAYDGEIRRQIQASHLFIFLISPDSVAAGYSLSELIIFQQSAPVPGKRLLPIMAVPTEMEALPGYLRSITILKPAGDLVADTVSQTARIAAWRAHRRMLAIAAALAVVLIVAGVVWRFKYSADAAPQRITLLKSLSLFHEPDQSSEIVAQLKPGDVLTLTKAPFNPNWVAVEANGAKAWAMTQDLVYQQIGGPGTIALGAGLGYEGSYWKLFFTTPRKEGQPPNKFGIDARFADAIGRTTKSLDIAVFEFNNPTVENAMVEAQRRGVKVRVVTGKLGYEEKNNRFPALEKAGLPIVVRPDSGLMHNKFAILDRAEVWTGSWNYTDGATGSVAKFDLRPYRRYLRSLEHQ